MGLFSAIQSVASKVVSSVVSVANKVTTAVSTTYNAVVASAVRTAPKVAVASVGVGAVAAAVVNPVAAVSVAKVAVPFVAKNIVPIAATTTAAVVVAKSSALQTGISNLPEAFDKGTSFLADAADEAAAAPKEIKDIISVLYEAKASGRELNVYEKQQLVEVLQKAGKFAAIVMSTAALFALYKNTIGKVIYEEVGKNAETPKAATPDVPKTAEAKPASIVINNIFPDKPDVPDVKTPSDVVLVPQEPKTPKKKSVTKKKAVKKTTKAKKKKTTRKKAKKKAPKKRKKVVKKKTKKRKK